MCEPSPDRIFSSVIPEWEQTFKTKLSTINAKNETVFESPLYRDLVVSKRCIIPLSGFFEWKKDAGRKRPFKIHLRSRCKDVHTKGPVSTRVHTFPAATLRCLEIPLSAVTEAGLGFAGFTGILSATSGKTRWITWEQEVDGSNPFAPISPNSRFRSG
ncbi:MAG: hypothetical protein DMG15_04050 [Acidobacteria bacterium]|nr:MAG: hypothetical protein DMG15_04050 [Acidobacteriota bacterium]